MRTPNSPEIPDGSPGAAGSANFGKARCLICWTEHPSRCGDQPVGSNGQARCPSCQFPTPHIVTEASPNALRSATEGRK